MWSAGQAGEDGPRPEAAEDIVEDKINYSNGTTEHKYNRRYWRISTPQAQFVFPHMCAHVVTTTSAATTRPTRFSSTRTRASSR